VNPWRGLKLNRARFYLIAHRQVRQSRSAAHPEKAQLSAVAVDPAPRQGSLMGVSGCTVSFHTPTGFSLETEQEKPYRMSKKGEQILENCIN